MAALSDRRSSSLIQRFRSCWRWLDRALPLLAKVGIPIVLIATAASFTVGSALVRDIREHFTRGYEAQARSIAKVVASHYTVNSDDREEMTSFLEDLRESTPGIVRVRLYRPGENGRVVWAPSGEDIGAEVPSADGRLPERLYPVGSKEAPAWLGLQLSSALLDQAVAQSERELVRIIAVALLAMLVAIGAVLYAFVLRRSARLARAAARVAEGELGVRLPEGKGPPGRDDLANVAREFDRMLGVVDVRNRQQAAVAAFGQLALRGADAPVLLEEAVRLSAQGLAVELATILEAEEDHLVVRAARGWPEGRPGVHIPLDYHAGYTMQGTEPVVVEDMATETRFALPPDLLQGGVRAGISVVIPGAHGPYGVLAGHTRHPRRFTEDDAHFLQAMANSLGAAIRHRRAQAELAEAEERYRTLVEQIPAVVYVDENDDNSTARYVSPYYEKMLGYTPEERISDPDLWPRLLHPEDRERVLAESRETNRTGRSFRVEYRMIARDGRVVWVRDEAVLLRDRTGETMGWQGILTDITERKRAEEALRRVMLQNKLILDSAGEGIFGLDLDGRITFVNPAAAEMLGHSTEELIGRPGHSLIHHSRADRSPYPEDECPIYGTFRDGVTRRMDDEVFWRADGTSFPVEYTSTPTLESGSLTGAVVTFADITERQASEETLRQAYDREREAAEQLRQIDEMKNAFLSAVSHELRTPLSAVLGYALTLRQEEINLPPEERRELLDRLATNAKKLQRLLADLLDVDRMERGILDPVRHPVDVAVLARRVAEETELAGREIRLEVQPVVAELDGPKVERIVENLLVNAAKHTPPGTGVRLSVGPLDGGVLIVVEDQGAGVPDELKEMVFQPFERGPEAPTHAPGTGIGLSLVSRFAELHGGRAWVEDRPGGGASFRVFLPTVSPGNGGGPPSGDVTHPQPDLALPRRELEVDPTG
jgi:PAS domain S-box-containing protein